MASEQPGSPNSAPKPPKDVGRVDVEIVGVDDVSRGQDPDRPPASDYARVVAATGFILVPLAAYALATPTLSSDTFVRSAALQSIGLWILIVVLFILPCVGTILAILGAVGAVACAVKAWNGQYVRIPVIWQIVRHWM